MVQNKKPKGYKPNRTNRSSWYFADKKTPISKQVFDIGQAYYNRMQNPIGRPRHRIEHTSQLTKFFYWTYITGSSQQEIFKQPLSLEIVREVNRDYINIKHVNQKNKAKNIEVIMNMPILDEWERQIWNFITDMGKLNEVEHIFEYKKWNSIKQNNISGLLIANFTTSLENPIDGKVHKGQGIPPNVLRYMRLRNLILEHEAPKRILNTWFGCDIKYMASKHTDLKKTLEILDLKEQRLMLEKAGLISNFKIGLGIIPSY